LEYFKARNNKKPKGYFDLRDSSLSVIIEKSKIVKDMEFAIKIVFPNISTFWLVNSDYAHHLLIFNYLKLLSSRLKFSSLPTLLTNRAEKGSVFVDNE